ncbi:hypothetical protein RHSIM_Rhsim12G0119300 [Rhododendron simsii]|uniref:Reverse transcriptase Ty1/copia-type domain-containing protein n=1 Tax=Rhododendron simsii TaxID=118357 RepID=A0A834G1Q9_RHOSS|nr:hypothetical protein RHSIM_Rhsim12G0119300 [Rhododendron simsii]
MNEEIATIEKNHTWDLVELPKGKDIIKLKWVYKTKYKEDGSIQKHIEFRHHFIRDLVQKGEIQLEFVNTKEQLADIMTKSVASEKFIHKPVIANIRLVVFLKPVTADVRLVYIIGERVDRRVPAVATEALKSALLSCLSSVGDKSGKQSKSAEEQKDWSPEAVGEGVLVIGEFRKSIRFYNGKRRGLVEEEPGFGQIVGDLYLPLTDQRRFRHERVCAGFGGSNLHWQD